MGSSRETRSRRPDPLERWLKDPHPRPDAQPGIEGDHAQRLLRLATAVTRAADESEAARLVAHAVVEWAGAPFAAVYLIGLDGGQELAAVAGSTRAPLQNLGRLAGEAIARGDVAGSGVGESDAAADAVRPAEPLAYPLRSGEACIGALVVAADTADARVATGLLDAIVEFAGLSIINVRRLGRAHTEARIDALTGLGNRRAFDEQLRMLIAEPAPPPLKHDVTLVVFDLDDFKAVNDERGHPAGDEVLRRVARTVLAGVRATDAVFRIGGDELALVIEHDARTTIAIARRLSRALGAQRRGPRLPTVSAGVASFPADAGSKAELLDRADLALYAAKRGGKNSVVAYSPQLGRRA